MHFTDAPVCTARAGALAKPSYDTDLSKTGSDALQMARGLIGLGLAEGDRVVGLLSGSAIELQLAATYANFRLSMIDPRRETQDIHTSLLQLKPIAIVVDAAWVAPLRDLLQRSLASVFVARSMGADLPPVWFDYDELRDLSPLWAAS